MRSFITDPRLHVVLDEIEAVLGHSVPARPMDERQQSQSQCLMEYWGDGEYIFKYGEGEPPKQTTLCHEMMHICRVLTGWPAAEINDDIDKASLEYEVSILLAMFIEHPTVWDMGKQLGFSEDSDHIQFLNEAIIQLFSHPRFVNPSFDNPARPLLVARIAEALLFPGPEKERELLLSLAQARCPQVLQHAQAVYGCLSRWLPLSLEACQPALEGLFGVMQVPQANIRLVFRQPIDRGLFQRMIKRIQQ